MQLIKFILHYIRKPNNRGKAWLQNIKYTMIMSNHFGKNWQIAKKCTVVLQQQQLSTETSVKSKLLYPVG